MKAYCNKDRQTSSDRCGPSLFNGMSVGSWIMVPPKLRTQRDQRGNIPGALALLAGRRNGRAASNLWSSLTLRNPQKHIAISPKVQLTVFIGLKKKKLWNGGWYTIGIN